MKRKPRAIKHLLPYKTGVELTFLPPALNSKYVAVANAAICEGDNSHLGGYIVSGYGEILHQHLKIKKQKIFNCGNDGHCVECSTSPETTWEGMEKANKIIRESAADIGLITHHEKVISGGGHIHVSGLTKKQMVRVFRDMGNRPYVNWIFNDPCDDYNADSFVGSLNNSHIRNEMKRIEKLSLKEQQTEQPNMQHSDTYRALYCDFELADMLYPSNFPQNKDYCMYNHGTDHCEFRMFGMATDWRQQKLHLNFVYAYLDYHLKHQNEPLLWTLRDYKKLKQFTFEKSIEEFKKLLKLIGLKFSDYKEFIDGNLTDRFYFAKSAGVKLR